MNIFNRFRSIVVVAVWLLSRLQALAAEASLVSFELESYDEKTYTQSHWAGHPLLVVVSTRESAPHNAGLVWSKPIVAAVTAAASDTALLRVSTLPPVPRLFRGMVRDALEPAEDDPIQIGLLDWEHVFAQRYDLSGEDYNVLVFDRRGALAYRVALGSFNQPQLDRIVTELHALKDRL